MAPATTPTPKDLAAFLAAERTHESGVYTEDSNPGGATGAYQFEPTTWSSNATEAGYPQYADEAAYLAPPDVQDAVAGFHASQMYKEYDGSWLDVAEGWYYPADVGKVGVVPIPGTNGTVTITGYGSSVVDTMNTILADGGVPAVSSGASSTTSTGTSSTATTTGLNINPFDLFGIPGTIAGAAAGSIWGDIQPFLAVSFFVLAGGTMIVLAAYKLASPGDSNGGSSGGSLSQLVSSDGASGSGSGGAALAEGVAA
jgi:hypothetical protein